jgi:hypothetical protein
MQRIMKKMSVEKCGESRFLTTGQDFDQILTTGQMVP